MKRRKFLELTSMGSAAVVTSLYFPQTPDQRNIKIGLIGSGWYGMVDVKAALKTGGVEVIGICDVDSEHLTTSADEIEKLQGPRPKTFKSYHDLLDMKGLEAVVIGTIPHWHALQFIEACNKGLDIYCEKPLAYDVMEGLAMVDAAKKAGNIVQIGFQRRQAASFKKVKELIETGKIGEVHQIVAQIHYNPVPQDTRIQPPPASLDWEEWCGPAPKLEYRPSIGHKSWRLEKEYGNGHLVDWGIHHIDIIRKIIGEGMPEEISATGGIFALKEQITTPDTLTATFGFKKFPVIWQHRLWGNGDVTMEFNNGIFFYGDKGTIFAEDSKVAVFLTGKDAKREDLSIPTPLMQENHVENFLKAVRNRDKTFIDCTPEDAFQSTAAVQLAMISYNTGTIVKWDEENKQILNNPGASALLKRAYRGEYIHP
jgi:predicted dehydrogenase